MTRAGREAGALELEFSLVTEADPPPGLSEEDLAALSGFVLREESAAGNWELTVALVNDERLQALHRDFMGNDTPTDIMTFPLEDDSGHQGGELVISVDHALTQAGFWGHSPAEEIRFLVTHGLLHLLGWRDDTTEQRAAMLARQQLLVEGWQRLS